MFYNYLIYLIFGSATLIYLDIIIDRSKEMAKRRQEEKSGALSKRFVNLYYS